MIFLSQETKITTGSGEYGKSLRLSGDIQDGPRKKYWSSNRDLLEENVSGTVQEDNPYNRMNH
jgi:hypothetical protein